jgi:hypothetical protein
MTATDRGSLRPQSYRAGEQLVHHSGEIWVVERVGDLADDEHSAKMLPLPDDYLICCVVGYSSRPLQRRRVHRDYLHGDGWRRRGEVHSV